MAKTTHMINPDKKKEMCEALGLQKIADKTASILDLNSKGVALEIAHQLVTGKESIPDSTKSELKGKAEKWLLANPEMQKLTVNAAKKILKGQPIVGKIKHKGEDIINIIKPKGSDVTAVMDMVTKRTEPVKGTQGPENVNLFIDTVQVAQFQSPDVVDGKGSDKGPVVECNEINELAQE
jgi:ABC-type branched-subunit amino acid transport system ATPase component